MQNPSPPPPQPSSPPKISEMDTVSNLVNDQPSTSIWDWSDFLDFNLDDQLQLPISWDSDNHSQSETPYSIPTQPPETSDRVRKRDPRLTCSNYLAGLVPCACPELDELLEEEEKVQPGKKKARTVRAPAGTAKCQVPGCEADIRELKGYHRRHRVCLRCASASAVVLDGQTKRYCQQCGKFHILSDFDEGKRSCRRKLERHNNRRRRKPADSQGAVEKDSREGLSAEDIACEDESAKDNNCLSSCDTEREVLLESEDGRISTLCSARDSQNIRSDCVVSFVASGETKKDEGKDDSKSLSPSYFDNKSTYSSKCPTGRISFKLYDWNPAEFPRRLRHQIFQWLSSMPVELEGYIRPGCTILTVFVAMPKSMWVKLFEDPAYYIHDFVVTPGKMLSGRGTLFVYLNDLIFRVMKDEISIMKVEAEVWPPKLHFVHPTCFEAGKPIEFVACGSNLSQPKFRSLVSFAGKYLAHDYCIQVPYGSRTAADTAGGFDHQLYKIYIPRTEPDLFGPVFIEVENQSGLSNFIPILIGDKEICSEMKTIQQKFDVSPSSEGSQFQTIGSLSDSCEVSVSRQRAFTEFLLDIGWLLKEPSLENMQDISSLQIDRFMCLLNFLIQVDSTIILGRVLKFIDIWMDNMEINNPANDITDAHMRLLRRKMNHARDIVHQKFQKEGDSVESVLCSVKLSSKAACLNKSFENSMCPGGPTVYQKMEMAEEGKTDAILDLTSPDRTETISLLNREVIMNVNVIKEHPRKSCNRIFSNTFLTTRPLIFVIATVAVCFGICVVLLHPQKVSKFAVTIRRCLFEDV